MNTKRMYRTKIIKKTQNLHNTQNKKYNIANKQKAKAFSNPMNHKKHKSKLKKCKKNANKRHKIKLEKNKTKIDEILCEFFFGFF